MLRQDAGRHSGVLRINDLRGSDVWPSGQIKDDVKNEFEGLRKKIKQVQEKLCWDDESTRESAGTSLHLARLADQVRRVYESIKEGRSGLDFDDLLVKTHGLLRDRPEILASDSVGGESPPSSSCWLTSFRTPIGSRPRSSKCWLERNSSVAGCLSWAT